MNARDRAPVVVPPMDVSPEKLAKMVMRHKPKPAESEAEEGQPAEGSLSRSPDSPPADLRRGDCLDLLPGLDAASVHLVVTDPPYFLDGLDAGWRNGRGGAKRATGTVGGLPVGMRFDPRQGAALQGFIARAGVAMFRVMKPGAFAVVFSQPRLAHRMAVGLEDAGFEIRDLYAWRFTRRAQSKAFTMDHFVDRMERPAADRKAIKRRLGGRKTPQLRPQFEAMILAQKPREGTFVDNWLAHETGLIDMSATLDGAAPATVMTVEKPSRERFNAHLTVKPLALIEHLIRMFSAPRQTVLDPFLGSGTTALAAARTGRACIGIEIDADYIAIAERRLREDRT